MPVRAAAILSVLYWSMQIARQYYGRDKLYVFNGLHNDPEGHTFEQRDRDRPVISNLFDTFLAVRHFVLKLLLASPTGLPRAHKPCSSGMGCIELAQEH